MLLISLTRKPKTEVYVNIDNVTTLARAENGTVIGFSGGAASTEVQESLEEILKRAISARDSALSK